MDLALLRMSRAGLVYGFFCTVILLLSHVHRLVNCHTTNMFAERSTGGQLRNFVFDSHTNSLYVGSVNSLYWLSGELGMLNSLELGPLNDHANCSFNLQEDCSQTRVPTPASKESLPNQHTDCLYASQKQSYAAVLRLNALQTCSLYDS